MRNKVVVAQFFFSIFRKVLFGVCFLGLGFSAKAQEPRFITFDAPGADTTPGDNNGTYPSGINAFGVIAGSFQTADTVSHGFIRSRHGEFITFQAPGADTTPGSFNGTSPSSINDLGVVTGSYWDATGLSHGFLRTPDGKFTTFDAPGAVTGTTPRAINFEGAVVGFYTDSNFSFHAFLRRPDGKFTTWIGPDACTGNGSDGCFGSGASNINAFGTVAGGFEDNSGNFVHHDFIRNAEGKLITFDVPSAGSGSYQGTGCPGCNTGLNQFGAIAGIFSDANSVNHGFVRRPDGKITTFDVPGAGTASYQGTGCFSDCPVSINDWGAITGIYIDANFTYHGYLRNREGKIVTVDPVGSIFTFPGGINDLGSITGYYIDGNGVYHGFLTIPNR